MPLPLRDFAFALLVGIASGAYSSIFIAAPVLTLWKEREPVYVRRRRIVMGDHGGRVPAFASGTLREEGTEAVAGGEPAAPRRRRRAAGPQRPRPATAAGPAPDAPSRPAGRSPAAAALDAPSRPAEEEPPAAAPPTPSPPATGEGPGGEDGAEGEAARKDGADGRRSSVSSTSGSGAAKAKPKRASGRSRSRKKHGRR